MTNRLGKECLPDRFVSDLLEFNCSVALRSYRTSASSSTPKSSSGVQLVLDTNTHGRSFRLRQRGGFNNELLFLLDLLPSSLSRKHVVMGVVACSWIRACEERAFEEHPFLSFSINPSSSPKQNKSRIVKSSSAFAFEESRVFSIFRKKICPK